MSNYDMIHENQVEILELSDEAMEAVAGGDGGKEVKVEFEFGAFFERFFNKGLVIFNIDK